MRERAAALSGRPAADPVLDMQMFMGTRGRERTRAEWQALAVKAGVVLEEIVALRSFARILVFRRGH